MKPDSMDAVFQALGSAVRRRVLDIVKEHPGCSVNDVCAYFKMSRIAVMKHLGLLEEAGLLISEKKGRTRHLYHNAVPIQMIYDRWTTEYSALWASRLTQVKYQVESISGGKRSKKGKSNG
jgi:predicted transcriptional regulator